MRPLPILSIPPRQLHPWQVPLIHVQIPDTHALIVLTVGFVLLRKHLRKIASVDMAGLVPIAKMGTFAFLALPLQEADC
jgi:hypothetical protein